MNKNRTARFCWAVLEKTAIICIALALYLSVRPGNNKTKVSNTQPDWPPVKHTVATTDQTYRTARMSAYVTVDMPDDPEPQLPPEDLEPQLPPENIESIKPTEPQLPSEPESKYPVRDDLIDGGNTLAYEYQIEIQKACEKYTHVPYAMALAVCDVESDFDKNAKSSTNDIGFMQINEINRAGLAKMGYDIDDPVDNIWAGIYMLDGHMAATDGNMAKALMRYNNGAGGAAKLWRKGVYETDYTKKVIKAVTKYENLLQDQIPV